VDIVQTILAHTGLWSYRIEKRRTPKKEDEEGRKKKKCGVICRFRKKYDAIGFCMTWERVFYGGFINCLKIKLDSIKEQYKNQKEKPPKYRYAFIIDHWNAVDIARMLSTELSPDDVLDLLEELGYPKSVGLVYHVLKHAYQITRDYDSIDGYETENPAQALWLYIPTIEEIPFRHFEDWPRNFDIAEKLEFKMVDYRIMEKISRKDTDRPPESDIYVVPENIYKFIANDSEPEDPLPIPPAPKDYIDPELDDILVIRTYLEDPEEYKSNGELIQALFNLKPGVRKADTALYYKNKHYLGSFTRIRAIAVRVFFESRRKNNKIITPLDITKLSLINPDYGAEYYTIGKFGINIRGLGFVVLPPIRMTVNPVGEYALDWSAHAPYWWSVPTYEFRFDMRNISFLNRDRLYKHRLAILNDIWKRKCGGSRKEPHAHMSWEEVVDMDTKAILDAERFCEEKIREYREGLIKKSSFIVECMEDHGIIDAVRGILYDRYQPRSERFRSKPGARVTYSSWGKCVGALDDYREHIPKIDVYIPNLHPKPGREPVFSEDMPKYVGYVYDYSFNERAMYMHRHYGAVSYINPLRAVKFRTLDPIGAVDAFRVIAIPAVAFRQECIDQLASGVVSIELFKKCYRDATGYGILTSSIERFINWYAMDAWIVKNRLEYIVRETAKIALSRDGAGYRDWAAAIQFAESVIFTILSAYIVKNGRVTPLNEENLLRILSALPKNVPLGLVPWEDEVEITKPVRTKAISIMKSLGPRHPASKTIAESMLERLSILEERLKSFKRERKFLEDAYIILYIHCGDSETGGNLCQTRNLEDKLDGWVEQRRHFILGIPLASYIVYRESFEKARKAMNNIEERLEKKIEKMMEIIEEAGLRTEARRYRRGRQG
jgi:hypothetical protein